MWQFVLPAVGMAAQVGGSLLNASGRNSGYDNRFGPNSPLAAERARQAEYQKRADEVLTREVSRFNDTPGQMATKAAELADYFGKKSAPLPTSGPTDTAMPVSQSRSVLLDAKPKFDKVAAYNKQQGDALGNLRSFGDVFADIGHGVRRDRMELGTINNFRQGMASIVPLEMNAAYKPPSQDNGALGDLLKLGGSLMTMYGLSGMGSAGGFSGTPQGLSTYGSPGYAASMNYGGPK